MRIILALPAPRRNLPHSAAFLRPSQRRRQGEPTGRHRQRAQRDRPDLEPYRLQAVEHPAVQRVGAAIDHHVDEVLRLVLLLAGDDREEHLARRIGDREVHPALGDLDHDHDDEARRQRQRREARDIDRRQRARRRAGAEPLEQLPGGEDLRRQGQQPDRQVDAGEDARLRAGAVDGRGHDIGLREIENGRAERQQADPRADAEQIGRAEELG